MKVLQAFALAALVIRLVPGARRDPLVVTDAPRPSPATREEPGTRDVEVVIPARNEELRIGPCLESLADQHVTVVDDDSSDDTAALGKSLGARVITAPPLPRGWVGKQNALQAGLENATGEWVLFLDADTRVEPGFVEAATARAKSEQLNIVSFSARFITHSVLHQGLQLSFLATLVYRFGPIASPTKKSPLINGQALLVKREWFLSQGGFRIAAGNMTDDIALARTLAARGVRIGFIDGSDLIEVDMFTSASDTWTQWGRSLAMNDVSSKQSRALNVALLFLTQVVPAINMARRKASPVDYALIAIRYALLIPFRKTVKDPGLGLALSPLLDGASLLRLIASTVRPNATWRGRTYRPSQTADR